MARAPQRTTCATARVRADLSQPCAPLAEPFGPRGCTARGGRNILSPLPLRQCDLAEVWHEVERLLSDDPDMLTYAQSAFRKLLELLTGRVSPLEVLFARGSLDTAEGIYERSPSARYLNAMVAAAVRSALEGHRGGGPFYLVEAGGGTGGTTSRVAEIFPADGEYWFTDLSDAFLGRARRRFGKNPAFRFTKFNLDMPPPAEFPVGRADVVLAANVVHATRDVGATLDRLRTLLKPGGLLVLIKSTTHHSIFDLTIGFIEGWIASPTATGPIIRCWRRTAGPHCFANEALSRRSVFPGMGRPRTISGNTS